MNGEKNITVAGLKIRCAYDELVEPSKLTPHPQNPNTHPHSQIEFFHKILQYQGARRPITVSKRSGFITKGHGFLETAIKFEYQQVPVDYQEYESEEEELADIVADNQLPQLAILNHNALTQIMGQLDTGAFDMGLTAFNSSEIEKMMVALRPAPEIGFQTTHEPSMTVGHQEPQSPADLMQMPISHVRMVQLFLNTDTLPEFNEMIEHFKVKYSTSNTTDTVMEIMREAYSKDRSEVPTSEG